MATDLTPAQLDAAFGSPQPQAAAPADYGQLFEDAGKKYNVDPALLKAVAHTESGGNPKAVSPQGAVGLMQLMPDTAKGLGVTDSTDPNQAIPAAAKLIRGNLDKYGNVEDALRAYHGGDDQTQWGPKTQAYPGLVAQAYSPASPQAAAPASADLTPAQLDAAFGAAPAKPAASPAQGTPASPATPTAQPAGKTLPQGMTPEQAIANYGNLDDAYKAADQQKSATAGLVQGVEDIPRGVIKTANAVLPAVGLGHPVGLPFEQDTQNRLAQYGGQPGFAPGRVLGNTLATAPIMSGVGGLVGKGATALGEAVPEIQPALSFLGGNATEGGNLLKYASRGANGALQGAAATPLLAATSDAPLSEQAEANMLFGGAAGAGIPAAADAGRAIANKLTGGGVNPLTAQLAQKAIDLGIPLRGGQITNSPFVKNVDSVLGQTPFSGYAGRNADQHTAFTAAVAKTFGAPEGTTAITPDVMQAAKDRIGGVMNDVAARTPIKADDDFMSHILQVQDEAKQVLPDSEFKPIQTQIDNILSKVGDDGSIDGKTYQALTRNNSPLDRAASSPDANVKYYATQVRSALDDALQRSAAPEDLAALQQARLQYKNMKTVEPLVLKGAPGEISPALLNGQVSKSFSNRAYTGAGDLGDLADIGQRFLREPPNSGTASRLGIMRLLEGAGLTGGAIGAYADPGAALQVGAGLAGSALLGRGVGAALGSDTYRNMLLRGALNNGSSPSLLGNVANNPAINRLIPTGINARQILGPGNGAVQ